MLRRSIYSKSEAKRILGLDAHSAATARDIRKAYFLAAKACHPDVQKQDDGGAAFRMVTVAYEVLQSNISVEDQAILVTEDEEVAFRIACRQVLGLPAEVVEESKQNPMFRTWLKGRTDGAFTWRNFLSQHGGLAPKLRPRLMIEGKDCFAGSKDFSSASLRRRKR